MSDARVYGYDAAYQHAKEVLARVPKQCLTTWESDARDAMASLLAATEPAPEPVSNAYSLPEEVREEAEAFRKVNSAQRDDSCTDAGCIVCKRREAGERLLASLAARKGGTP